MLKFVLPMGIMLLVGYIAGTVRALLAWNWDKQAALRGLWKVLLLFTYACIAALLDQSTLIEAPFNEAPKVVGAYLAANLMLLEGRSILKAVTTIVFLLRIHVHGLSRVVDHCERVNGARAEEES